ncbi:MAG: glycoside hydrolase family 16 protein [Polyangiaceae bacterium]|nr:glycoside hydrolase family 16 protein [Polyangiaceae bacterium]
MEARTPSPLRAVPRRAARGLVRHGHAAAVALAASACGGSVGPQTTSSTHWLECREDSDCNNLSLDACCGADGYCASSAGVRLERRPVFAQEFADDALDPSAFGYEIGAGIRNDEPQTYTDRPENVRIEGDALVLTARAEDYEGAAYTSGSVNTEGRFAFTFGRVEARLAAPSGRGCSTAFWMLPEAPAPAVNTCIDPDPCYSGTWPAWGDITIANLQSQVPGQVLGAVSYGVWDETTSSVSHGVVTGEPATVVAPEDWHVYAVEWGPARIDWYVDDVQVRTLALPPANLYLPDGIDPFRQPFHLRLNLALGGFDQAPVAADYPQELRIDWVRVSQWLPRE